MLSKTGGLTSSNESFLLLVYLNAITDTIVVLLNSQDSIDKKISGVINIFTHKYTEKIISKNDWNTTLSDFSDVLGQCRNLFSIVVNWMFTLNEVPDALDQGYCDVGEMLCDAIGEPDSAMSFIRIRKEFEMGQS